MKRRINVLQAIIVKDQASDVDPDQGEELFSHSGIEPDERSESAPDRLAIACL